MLLYVLTKVGVYDHGCAGVFDNLVAAEAHATSLWRDSDGYHGYRVDQVPLNYPIKLPDFQGTFDRKGANTEPPIEINEWVPLCEAKGCERPATMTATWHEAEPDACDEHGKDPMKNA